MTPSLSHIALTVRAALRKCANLSPRVAGCTYLACVPLFALIYYTIGGEFFQTTGQFEPAAIQRAHRAESDLGAFVHSWFRELPRDRWVEIDFPIVGLQAQEGSVVFQTVLAWNGKNVETHEKGIPTTYQRDFRSILQWRISFPAIAQFADDGDAWMSVSIDDVPNWVLLRAVTPLEGPFYRSWSHLRAQLQNFHPDLGPEASDASLRGILILPKQTYESLNDYYYASRGASPALGFGRLFYFSAVTITTLGYGDIVPLSDRARLAVACEALVGIALGGLFLSGITRR